MLNSKIQFIRMSRERSEKYAQMSERREGALPVRRHLKKLEPDDGQSAVDPSPSEPAADEPQVN
jgi:hypothetical protein